MSLQSQRHKNRGMIRSTWGNSLDLLILKSSIPNTMHPLITNEDRIWWLPNPTGDFTTASALLEDLQTPVDLAQLGMVSYGYPKNRFHTMVGHQEEIGNAR